MKDNIPTLTPIETIDGVYLKRDDLYCRSGIRGGKVRACWHLATRTHDNGPGLLTGLLPPAEGLITASARKSPQAQIVARLAHTLGIPARCHMPRGEKTEEMKDMEAHGGELIQHKAGYNNVIIARAREDMRYRSAWRYIPFGMEHLAALACTRNQVQSIPVEMAFGNIHLPKRIIICLGSGMSAAGVLHGLAYHQLNIPVIGIQIGADPTKRLNHFAPRNWWQQMDIINITDKYKYHEAVEAKLGNVLFDPHYESKCLEYVEHGDLFWVVGIRATQATNIET